ncbi:LOW QUALITY PROTEIN: solute carrier organic anion transporter family member 1A5-like [Alexandromys fortis]|uniref:LOW QUALITY PROTEIN: solute carrier organic anion transporter family member 1A5-like n=1 Tax=Alexandromys fortis TaxID=100897 RepID=UPI00215325C1|nr:LOW QUALITY PROTEIN: solute carrier organic anion transporter family member 1A5-like [Microtus fortis]
MGEPGKRFATHGVTCFSKMKMFLLALTVAYLAKSISGIYMVSMLTQIERQFNIPTSVAGFINGSFEIGELHLLIIPLLIIFVSYFGTKLHRPIMIGAGCVVMGLGCFLISLPHFLMGRYEYEKMTSPSSNLSSNSFLCSGSRSVTLTTISDPEDCEKEIKSLMWIYVMVGNLIHGIGETPIMPLGISYIEDFAKPENSPFYIGILEAGNMVGPFIGLLLASFSANIYVDTGSMNTDDLTITPTDTRWVGAWWVGFLICAGVNVLTSIPFFFLPNTLPKEGLEDNADVSNSNKEEKHQDFLPFMKSLFCNPIYMILVLVSVLQISSYAITFVFTPKYCLEQQFGKSTAEIVFLMGIYNLPAVCIGYLISGLVMKKFKFTVKKAAYVAFCLSLTEWLLFFLNFLWTCDNFPVAGLTTSYEHERTQQPLYVENKILANCNTRCNCLTKMWDPVCGDNGIAYMSACCAGCEKSVGTGINMVFQNCSCIQSSGNSSADLGLCKKGPDCTIKLQYFFITAVIGSFIYSLAAIPGYVVLLRCIKSEEKSLGVGLHAFFIKVFAGIPVPIYFGALTDRTCLHWGTRKCGKAGACRMYDINNFGNIFLGLPAALRGSSFFPAICILILLRKFQLPEETDSSETEFAEMKLTEKESECMDVHRSPESDNDKELKTRL